MERTHSIALWGLFAVDAKDLDNLSEYMSSQVGSNTALKIELYNGLEIENISVSEMKVIAEIDESLIKSLELSSRNTELSILIKMTQSPVGRGIVSARVYSLSESHDVIRMRNNLGARLKLLRRTPRLFAIDQWNLFVPLSMLLGLIYLFFLTYVTTGIDVTTHIYLSYKTLAGFMVLPIIAALYFSFMVPNIAFRIGLGLYRYRRIDFWNEKIFIGMVLGYLAKSTFDILLR